MLGLFRCGSTVLLRDWSKRRDCGTSLTKFAFLLRSRELASDIWSAVNAVYSISRFVDDSAVWLVISKVLLILRFTSGSVILRRLLRAVLCTLLAESSFDLLDLYLEPDLRQSDLVLRVLENGSKGCLKPEVSRATSIFLWCASMRFGL